MKTIIKFVRKQGHTYERGQAMILIAGAFIALAAFIGLAIDSGILFTQIGHLRRAVDTSALSAANQFREGQTVTEIEDSAKELIVLNMPEIDLDAGTTEVRVFTCATDHTLCPPSGEPPRKLVRVVATHQVEFAFLPIIGIDNYTITADAISEAASLDLILVIDTSPSMSYDAMCGDGDDDDGDGTADDGCAGGPAQVGPNPDDFYRDQEECVLVDECHPFEEVREAAIDLMDRVYFPYDRVSLVTFDRVATLQLDLTYCSQTYYGNSAAQKQCVIDELNDMVIIPDPDPATFCTDWPSTGDPRGCMSTNSAGGLLIAGNEFGNHGRDESVWIVIFLSDGVANAGNNSSPPTLPEHWVCPEDTWRTADNPEGPFCNDGVASTRHLNTSTSYDSDDYARDMADFVGCLDADSPVQYCTTPGQGAVVFAVGLGDRMTSYTVGHHVPGLDADLGEKLLRYVANIGFDGDPSNDPCSSVSSGLSCGNYFYAATGADIGPIFEAIASRIFTRLTH
ncbi:MAG: VWA domain-containing protein [Anaerolineales bacterium]|nr:VWA domain-containing protein [Anaerolineales bacterium]